MPDGIDISWDVAGQEDLVKALNDAADASERASAALKKQGESTKFATGPNQNLAKYQEQLARATRQGNAPAISDISRRIEATNRQLAPKTVASFTQKLERAIRSTRFNTAGGVSPLIGQVSDLVGVSGPWGAAIVGAEKALEGFSEAVKAATEAGNQFGNLQSGLGSGGQTTGALKNLGYSASDASSFNDLITHDPQAIATAARFGISNAPGPFGQQDFGKEMLDAIKKVRAETDKRQQLADARTLHIDPVILRLSDASFNKRVGSDAAADASVFDDKQTSQSAEYENAQKRLQDAGTRILAKITAGPVSDLTKIQNEMADLFSGKMSMQGWMHSTIVQDGTLPFLPGYLAHKRENARVGNQYEDEFGNAVDPKTKALQDNTKAVQENTNTLGIGQRQYGHGERTDKAIPRVYGIGSGYNLRENLHTLSRQLGAFG